MCSSRGNNTRRARNLRRLTSAAFTTMRVSHVENFERLSNERSFVYADNKPHCTASSASSLLRSTENAVRNRRPCSRAKTAASASVSPAMARLTITDSSLAGRKSGLATAFLDGCACERSSLRQCRVCGGMAPFLGSAESTGMFEPCPSVFLPRFVSNLGQRTTRQAPCIPICISYGMFCKCSVQSD